MGKIKIIASLWFPVIIWMIVIFSFSSMQVGSASDFYWKDFIIKKSAHLFEYGILATLVYRALINSKVSVKKAMLLSVLWAFLYGCTDEFHQSFTPGRGPKFTDVLIDTTGATLFIYVFLKNKQMMSQSVNNFLQKLSIK